MKRIAVLTSGGDAPGMNAAIRAVVRIGMDLDCEVFGVRNGYAGLIRDDIQLLSARDVGGIIQLGGTVLGSARAPEFKEEAGRRTALDNLASKGIEGLVVIGGNGSQTGAAALNAMGFPVVGVASTIDNDLIGSEITIGVDTALNIALEAIDRLKVTASSHRRAFMVEVMGRHCGYLALMAGIAGGAECIVIPEQEITPEQIAGELRLSRERGKKHAIIIVAEGATFNADKLEAYFKSHEEVGGYEEVRVTKLGHVQRGGAPGAFDRILATRFGAAATETLVGGQSGVLVGLVKSEITHTPLADVVGRTKKPDLNLLKLAQALTY